jgi:hypothetical protein
MALSNLSARAVLAGMAPLQFRTDGEADVDRQIT